MRTGTIVTRRKTSASIAMILCVLIGLTALVAASGPSVSAQSNSPTGHILYVRSGNIWEWSPDHDSMLLQDGSATSPAWSPDESEIIYSRNGGSYSNLVLYRPATGTRSALTNNESYAEKGSEDYVLGSSWANDPFWSASGIVCFVSDVQSQSGAMTLWVLGSTDGQPYQAASDGSDAGNIEHVSVDASGTWAVYTVEAPDDVKGGITYVALRNLNTGATSRIGEGTTGAYDADISQDGAKVVMSIRNASGTSDLWLYDIASGKLTQLTAGQDAARGRWSPDDRWIAYIKPGNNTFETWAIPINANRDGSSGNAVKLFSHDDIDAPGGLSWGS